MQWIFPDEAIRMNRIGVQPMRPNYVAPMDADIGQASYWVDEARQVALNRVENTRKAKLGMEGKANTTERSQRYERPASRSAVPNGIFHGSPMEYVTSGGLRGGVITTKEGQEWLAKRLQQRIAEYDAISTGNFSRGPPRELVTSPYLEVDSLLSQIFSAFGTGSFTGSTADALNKLLQAIIRIGAVIEPSQLGNYARAVQKLAETIRGYRGGEVGLAYDRGNIEGQLMGEEARAIYNPAEERLRLVQSMSETLKLIDGAIREIARVINESKTSREQVMSTLSQRLLGKQIGQFNPEYATANEPEREQAIRNVPGVPLGVPSGRELLGPTFEEERQRREEEEAFQGEQARRELEASFGEAANFEGLGRRRRGRPRKH
jgi:hypothetical protein